MRRGAEAGGSDWKSSGSKRKTREMPEVVYNGRKVSGDIRRVWESVGECGRGLDVTVRYKSPEIHHTPHPTIQHPFIPPLNFGPVNIPIAQNAPIAEDLFLPPAPAPPQYQH